MAAEGPKEHGISFTRTLRKHLEELNITQAELAKKSGLSTAYVNRLCRGRQFPGWKALYKITRALGLNLGDFSNEQKG